jgi:glycosyltransferase involved in cell wall biosynthesis
VISRLSSLGPRVAIISDTVDDENGVSIGLRRLVAAARAAGHEASLIGAARAGVVDEVVRIPSAMNASLPIYPDMTWSVPEVPPLASWLAKHADLVQVATPGPMGIAGLVAARMMGLPVIAQYHTEVAEYAARMTGMPMVKMLVEPIVGWFYKQADLCLAPSEAVEKRLTSFGIPSDRIWRVQRGVDRSLFDPARRDRSALARFGITNEPVALYVGRLSKEKNLDTLTAVWSQIHEARPDARLLVVGGEGPLRGTFKAPGMIETGSLYGEELATVFASSDLFVFPSETETFGNVVIEAAASGIPALVATLGASHEHVVDGVTGRIVDASDRASFASTAISLLDDAALCARMGNAAREHVARYDLADAVATTWEIYARVMAERAAAIGVAS